MLTEWGNWNLALGYTKRVTEETGAATAEDHESETSIGYGFDFGLKAGLGWKRTKDDGVSTDAIGLQFTYSVEF